MSCNPQQFGRALPTASDTRRGDHMNLWFLWYSLGSICPLLKRVVVPARQVYSHSASLGRRKVAGPWPVEVMCAFKADTNDWQLFHET